MALSLSLSMHDALWMSMKERKRKNSIDSIFKFLNPSNNNDTSEQSAVTNEQVKLTALTSKQTLRKAFGIKQRLQETFWNEQVKHKAFTRGSMNLIQI